MTLCVIFSDTCAIDQKYNGIQCYSYHKNVKRLKDGMPIRLQTLKIYLLSRGVT